MSEELSDAQLAARLQVDEFHMIYARSDMNQIRRNVHNCFIHRRQKIKQLLWRQDRVRFR